MTAKDEYENVLKKQVKKMRKFMFRGKVKNKADYELIKSMYSDNCKNGFIYGSLIVGHGKYYICVTALCQVNSLVNNGRTTMFEVFPETVGEYTGLRDKIGKRIFEGDIVTMPKYGGGRHKSVVYFKNGKFAVNGSNYNFKDICPKNMEVIGNISDNPELLKEV